MPKTEISSGKSSKTWAIPPAICYRLSDKVFVDKGWTFLSDVTPVGKVVTMEAKFSHREISPWFKERGEKFIKRYGNGKILCHAYPDGSGKIFYPNGKLGIEIKKTERNKKTQILVMSPGGVCEDGIRRPAKLAALFDSFGNGVIYNHKGEKRMVYDQNHGVLWDAPNGVPVYWKWHHLQYFGSLTTLYSFEESLLEEESNFQCREMADEKSEKKQSEKGGTVKATTKSDSIVSLSPITSSQEITSRFSDSRYVNTSKLHPPQAAFFKPMTVKINKYVSLTIFDQANVVLKFFAESHQTRLEIGILYDPQNKHSVQKIERVSEKLEKVLCNYEVLPATTKSMQKLKNALKMIKKRPSVKNKD